MKIFLDTNVLASAVATRGLCADILRLVLATHDLVTTDPILQELDRVLKSKFGVPEERRKQVLHLLREDVTFTKAAAPLKLDIKDKADITHLQAAVAEDTELFVTGDKEVLGLKKIGKMSILSPRAFWEKVKAEPGN